MFCSFSFFFLFAFSVLGSSVDISSGSLILSSALSSLLMSPSQVFSHNAFHFWRFLLICSWTSHISVSITHLFWHVVQVNSIRTLSVLILVLNSLSDNFSISAVYKSGLKLFISLRTLSLPFSAPCHSLLTARHAVPGKGTEINCPLG